MKADNIIQTQLLMAQALGNLATLVKGSVGYKLAPVAFAALPVPDSAGAIACVSDSNTVVWGATIAGAGANKVLAFYNGSVWTVAGK